MSLSHTGMTLYSNQDTQESWVGTDDLDAYNKSIQGANSESWNVAKNSTETGVMTKSANMGVSKYFIGWMASDLSTYYTSIKNVVESTTNNNETFTIADTTNRDVTGEFHPAVLQFGRGTALGTLDKTSVTKYSVIVDNSSSGNIRSVINNWLDTMHYGDGRVIAGSTVSDKLFEESHTLDTTTNDEYDGCSELFPSGLAYYTDIEINTTLGNSFGEKVTFYGSRNTDSIFTLSVTGTADFRNAIVGNSCKVNFDTSTAVAYSASGASLSNGGTVTHATGQTIDGYVYSSCNALKPNGATLSNITIDGTTEATTGALEIVSSTDISTLSKFTINNYNGKYAIYIPASVTGTISLNNFVVDGSGVDIYWAGTSGTLTVQKSNGTNVSTWSAGGTATVNITSSVSIAITVQDESQAVIPNAYVYIDDDIAQAGNIVNTQSDVNGEVATAYSGVKSTATIRVRLYGYYAYKDTFSLLSDTNKTVTLRPHPQQQ